MSSRFPIDDSRKAINRLEEDNLRLMKQLLKLEEENAKLIQICNEQSRAIDTLNYENQSLLKQMLHKRWLEDVFGTPDYMRRK